MTIKRLIQALPPPSEPLEPFTDPWEPVETYLGTRLPQDYKDFARLYGRGRVAGLLYVNLPGSPDQGGSLEGELDLAREMVNYGVPVPYPAWPDTGGLPDDWKVVFWDRGASENECFEEFDCGMAEFLAGLADGSILPKGHQREDLEPIGPIFQPYSHRVED